MAWRDRLQPASFRGVPFFVDSADLEAGRRVVLHEYPLRDLPSAQDLGRAQRKVGVTAYVLGKDYLDARDRLLKALETGGAGTLILPTWPAQQMVLAAPARLSESKEEGGICRIALQFAEAGEPVHPAAAGGGPNAAAERVTVARTAARDAFLPRWGSDGSLGGIASLVTDALVAEYGGLVQAIVAVASDTGSLASVGGRILGTLLNDHVLGNLAILADAGPLAESLMGAVVGLVDDAIGTDRFDPLSRGLRAVFEATVWGSSSTGTAWPRGQTQPGWFSAWPRSTNRRVLGGSRSGLQNLLLDTLMIETARHLDAYEPTSTADAVDRRNQMMADLDSRIAGHDAWEAEFATETRVDRGETSAVTAALGDLAVFAAERIGGRGAGKAVRVLRQVLAPPALVLAYDHYEDERRSADIVARNQILHPGMPGFTPRLELETL